MESQKPVSPEPTGGVHSSTDENKSTVTVERLERNACRGKESSTVDPKTKKEKEAELDKRIEALRKRNEALAKRHHEVQEDKKKAEQEGIAVTTPRKPCHQEPETDRRKFEKENFAATVDVCKPAVEWEEKRRQNIEKMNEEMERIAEYERGQRVSEPPILDSVTRVKRPGPKGSVDVTMSKTGGEREYLRWKKEREQIDEEKLARNRNAMGQWRREWDAHKTENILKSKRATSSGDSVVWDPPLDLSSPAENVNALNRMGTKEHEEPLEFQPQLKLPASLKEIRVRVSYVSSPSNFYVQLCDFDSHLKRVSQMVKQECAGMKVQNVAWKADMYCAAHINGVWERGQICTDVTSSIDAEVKRCDHGGMVKLPVRNLRPLPPSLFGSLALECSLNDIRPAGGRSTWTDTACDLFAYYLTGASALMTIKEFTGERPVPVTLLRSNEKGEFISIADFLVGEGLALKEIKPRDVVNKPKQTEAQPPVFETQINSTTENTRPPSVSPPPFSSGASISISIPPEPSRRLNLSAEKIPTVMPAAPILDDWDINTEGVMGPEEPLLGSFVNPSLPQDGERFKVRVKHLRTPNELFLCVLKETADLEADGETLDEALIRINANINCLPQLTSFPLGGPCLAEYSDGNYYRARLMKITSVDPIMILVQHVDSGSDDTLPPSKLRQMPAELLRFPSQALKVKVAGFKAPSVNWNEDVLPNSPEWSVKAVKEMLDVLHGNITATVVAREPELKMQLYTEDGEPVHQSLVSSGLAELD